MTFKQIRERAITYGLTIPTDVSDEELQQRLDAVWAAGPMTATRRAEIAADRAAGIAYRLAVSKSEAECRGNRAEAEYLNEQLGQALQKSDRLYEAWRRLPHEPWGTGDPALR